MGENIITQPKILHQFCFSHHFYGKNLQEKIIFVSYRVWKWQKVENLFLFLSSFFPGQ